MQGRNTKLIQNVVGNPEGKRPLGRLGHKWEDDIKMYLESRV
jgi:hypothetical protein